MTGLDIAATEVIARDPRPLVEPTDAMFPSGIVYFVAADEVARVKIGWSNSLGSVRSRVDLMQVGAPTLISLAGFEAGDRYHERGLHRRFRHLHHHGEWFDVADDLIAHILSLPRWKWRGR